MKFTVLGASGFIGANLVRWLESQSISYWAPQRGENVLGKPLGHVIYCIGLTADFRGRPFDTVQAHVCHLMNILEKADFESFLCLSSTRLYIRMRTSHEDAPLQVSPTEPEDLYNISKIMGESLCLSSNRQNVRIVRPSNVYGGDFSSNNFLPSVIKDAIGNGKVVLRTTLDSEKDYANVNDVVSLLPQIALAGRHQIYNIGSGVNTSHGALLEVIQRKTGCTVDIADNAETVIFPVISINRIQDEFNFSPSLILHDLENLIDEYQLEFAER